MNRTVTAKDDSGYTLAEILVAISIFMLLLGAIMTTVLSTSRAVNDARSLTNINSEARLAMERFTREVRQSNGIISATLPAAVGGDTSLTFTVDFNGNGVIDDLADDPETLTYTYDSANKNLTLSATQNGSTVTAPILSAQVTKCIIQFRSSLWQYDTNGDGQTDWTELDANPTIGNNNNKLDGDELELIDSVVISITLLEGSHAQTYQTQVHMRNRQQS